MDIKQAKQQHEDWIEQALRKEHQQQEYRGQQLSDLMRSEWGATLIRVFEDIRDTYRDAHVWAETAKERSHAKGGILCVEAIMAYLKLNAEQYAQPVDDRDRGADELFQGSSFTVGTGSEDV